MPSGSLPPEVAEVLPYDGWAAAEARLHAVIAQRGMAVLVGVPGVGKTTMLRMLANGSTGRNGPILADDAHLLQPDRLAALLNRRGPRVLAGPHALVERLGGVRGRLAVVELPTVQPDELAGLLQDLLGRLEGAPAALSPATVAALGREAQGRAGRLVALARLAIFLARLEGADGVHPAHAEQAAAVSTGVDLAEPLPLSLAAETRWRPEPAPARLGRVAMLAAAAAALPHGLARQPPLPPPPMEQASAPASAPADPPSVEFVLPPPPPVTVPVVAPVHVPPALPMEPLLHVTLFVPPGDPAAVERGRTVAGQLQANGYDVAVRAPNRAWGPGGSLRYFFTADRSAAVALADTLGVPVQRAPDRAWTREEPPRPHSAEITVTSVFPRNFSERRLP